MRPQIPGLSPGGLGPHLTSSGSPAGFPPVSRMPAGFFPFVRLPLVSLRPAFSGSFPSAVARFRFPSVSLRFPFPLGNLHVSAAAGRYRRRRSQAAGTKVTSSAATTSPGSRDPPALQMGSGWPRWDAATESPVMSGAERRTSPRLNRAGGVLRGRPSLRLLSVTDFPSASVLGWQRSRLPTTWEWPRSLAVPMVLNPVRGR